MRFITTAFVSMALLAACSDAGKFTGSANKASIDKPAESSPEVESADVEVPAPKPAAVKPDPVSVPPEAVPAPNEVETVDVDVDLIPGEPIVRLGLNFEDSPGGDNDYNDAVLCFEGNFRAEGTSVISTAAQEVIATTSSLSGCRHDIEVLITHADNSSEAPIRFDSRTAGEVKLNFRIGDKLDVTMIPTQGCSVGARRLLTDPVFAQVLPNVCNTSGN